MTRFIAIVWLTLCCVVAQAKEVIPPAPKNHFNDYAGVVSQNTATTLNNELTQFERDTGNQFLVAIYRNMQTDSSIEDYTVRIARAWGVGTKEKNNGVVLFIFTQDHKLFIQTGYGLEGALPDALCKRIIEDEIVPRFKQGDFNGGVTASVHAVIAATKGEYKGTGRTVKESQGGQGGDGANMILFLLLLLFLGVPAWIIFSTMRRGFTINRRGYSGGFWTGGGGGWSGGGWSSGGGGFGGGGGSFSGGGGSFGGGGAGGSW